MKKTIISSENNPNGFILKKINQNTAPQLFNQKKKSLGTVIWFGFFWRWKYFRRISHLYQFSSFFAENVCFRTLPYERYCSTFLWKTFGQNQVVHGKFNGSNPPSSQMYNWRKKRQKICKTPLCLSGPNWRILPVQNLILYHEN